MKRPNNLHKFYGYIEVALVVKNLPANVGDIRDTGLIPGLGRFPGGEHAMATHSSILAWRIPWTEKPGGLQSMGSQSPTQLSDYGFHFHTFFPVKNASPDFYFILVLILSLSSFPLWTQTLRKLA